MVKILGIETTCDETAAAVVQDGRVVLSNIVASQTEIHDKYGGIVPEIASRKHLEMLPIVVKEALDQDNFTFADIDYIAIAKEPGLPPALSVGFAYASGLALAEKKPLIEVNHLDAHVSSTWLVGQNEKLFKIPFPYLCLLVSGGHTELRLVSDEHKQKILGKTVDAAAGEAFDKVARLLELGYPGGPIIDKLAQAGDEAHFTFPRPMSKEQNYDFSFSGLKTAVLRQVQQLQKAYQSYEKNTELHNALTENWKNDVAASFQEAVVDVLVEKTAAAAAELGIQIITMAGGVSANSRLREKMGRLAHEMDLELYYPELKYCVDNAAMIAGQAFFQLN